MCTETGLQRIHSTDCAHSVDGEYDHSRHLDDKLHEVGPENRPHPRAGGISDGDDEADADGDHLPGHIHAEDSDIVEAERDGEDFYHRPRHPAEDDQVDGKGQIEGAESAQRCGWLATVADLGELDVGHDVGASPQSREEEYGEHAAHQHVPPDPVAGDAVIVDEPGDNEGGIGRESCRYHGGASEPPGHVASGDEVFAETFAALLGEGEADSGGKNEIGGYNSPVDRS